MPGTPKVSRFGVLSWLPMAFVVVTLLLLLYVPLVVDRRTRALWRELDEGNRVRILLNDLEAAGATQALISARGPTIDGARGASDSLADQAARSAAADDRELDSLLRTALPESRPDLDTIETIERSWRAARERRTGAPDTSAAGRGQDGDPLRLLAAAEHLDDRLMQRLDSLRARSRELQQVTVVSAVVLTPIALLSVLAVFWSALRAQRLARRLEDEREALAREVESRAALVRGITHDLKNPLGAASGFVDLMLDGITDGPLSERQAAALTRVRRLLAESTATVSSLLELARMHGTEALSVETRPVDVMALVADVVEDYRPAARESALSLTLEQRDEVGAVITDPRHLRHILGNLLSNAVKYTPERGTVRVRISRRGPDAAGVVCIAVCDSGRGIPPAMRDAIFDEFVRLDVARSEADGHGVGLAISRRLARMLGGNLAVGDAPEGGAMFTLELPAAPRQRG